MEKEQVIEILEGLMFKVDYDQWKEKRWIRFYFRGDSESTLIVYRDTTLKELLKGAAQLIHISGQRDKIHQINSIVRLD